MKQGARTRLIPASAKGVRKVERSGETARPVAGQGNVYLEDINDLLLVRGFHPQTNDPASIPFSLKTFHSGTVHRE